MCCAYISKRLMSIDVFLLASSFGIDFKLLSKILPQLCFTTILLIIFIVSYCIKSNIFIIHLPVSLINFLNGK